MTERTRLKASTAHLFVLILAACSGSSATSEPGGGGSCGQLATYCASPSDSITCSTTEAQATALLCANQAGHTTLQRCSNDLLTVVGVDSSTTFAFNSAGQLVGVTNTAVPRGGNCYGASAAPSCASPSVDPCAADAGANTCVSTEGTCVESGGTPCPAGTVWDGKDPLNSGCTGEVGQICCRPAHDAGADGD
jgi:hypothetical protein